MKFEHLQLPNGLNIVAEINPNVHSVAFGFFVRVGSRDETAEVSGVSHFLEHMVFKGTETLSPLDVNRIFDEVGAKYNASTSEEITLFYAAVLPEYFATTFSLIASILYPTLRSDDFDMEKKVILEEIGMYDDMPAFSAYEKLMQLHFQGHPLSQSILGSVSSITDLTAEQMRAYHASNYRAGNITLAVAGNINWQDVVQLAEAHCSDWPAGTTPRNTREAKPQGGMQVIEKSSIMQENIASMAPAPSAQSPLRFAADLLSVVIGDDSNSRLYWSLIETGKAEAAELSFNEYDGTGAYMSFLTCHPDDVESNLEAYRVIFQDINQNGVTDEELEQARNKVASRIVLRSERPMGRLGSLGNNWVYRNEYQTVEDDLKTLHRLTRKDIRELLDQYPLQLLSQVAIGPRTGLELA